MGEQQFSTSSWLWRFTDVYDMLWKMVIRPPRDLYSPDELGPDKFRLGKHVYIRHDLELTSSRGVLQCSHFLPAKGVAEARPCVVYLHGNCSSRLEAFDALPVLLPLDVSVFSMDLSGSGRSDGEYISLGYHEEHCDGPILGGMLSQAEEGMKLFAQAAGTAAEFDRAGAEKYKDAPIQTQKGQALFCSKYRVLLDTIFLLPKLQAEVEQRIAGLEAEAALLTGKDNKKERAAKGKEVAELKAEQCYVDACKIVKGLEPKFGYFVTKA
ncbi:unnamed protein product, partial [Effrenium voratum]